MTEHEALTRLMRRLVTADELTMKLRWALQRGDEDEIESVRGDLTMALGEVAGAISTWEVVTPSVRPCQNCAGTGYITTYHQRFDEISGVLVVTGNAVKLLCRDCNGTGERE